MQAAQLAADNALQVANVYATTALGLAATVNGEYFSVPGSGEFFLEMYENVAGAAVFSRASFSSTKIAGMDAALSEARINLISTQASLIGTQAIIAQHHAFN